MSLFIKGIIYEIEFRFFPEKFHYVIRRKKCFTNKASMKTLTVKSVWKRGQKKKRWA